MSELLNAAGAVSIVAFTLNYAPAATEALRPWSWFSPSITSVLVFWVLFALLVFVKHLVLKRVTELIKWERAHWVTQGLGSVLGGLRGLWWSGFIVLALSSSGFVYLHESVAERSLLGPRLLTLGKTYVERVADRFPGAQKRGPALMPPLKPTAH